MDTAEIVDHAEQENGVSDGAFGACQTMRPTDERRQVGPERTIEALDESGVNLSSALAEAA